MPDLHLASQSGRVASELDDALYYLRRDCRPCAQRHLGLARQYGASDEQVDAVLAAGAAGSGPTAGG